MTEDELIELGFTRVDVPISESGNKNDYYYYSYDLGFSNMCISSASDETLKDRWLITGITIEDYDLKIENTEEFQLFLNLIKKWKK